MKTWIKRSLRTFVQTAVGYVTVNLAVVDFTADGQALKTAVIGLCVSAISAGAAAVMNLKEEEK